MLTLAFKVRGEPVFQISVNIKPGLTYKSCRVNPRIFFVLRETSHITKEK